MRRPTGPGARLGVDTAHIHLFDPANAASLRRSTGDTAPTHEAADA